MVADSQWEHKWETGRIPPSLQSSCQKAVHPIGSFHRHTKSKEKVDVLHFLPLGVGTSGACKHAAHHRGDGGNIVPDKNLVVVAEVVAVDVQRELAVAEDSSTPVLAVAAVGDDTKPKNAGVHRGAAGVSCEGGGKICWAGASWDRLEVDYW